MPRKSRQVENAKQKELQAWSDRGWKALKLRASGMSYREIAETLDFSDPTSAYRAVARALERTRREASDEVRQMELTRLDEMLLGLWPKVQKGDPKATMAALAVLDRRAKYLGLDMPEKTDTRLVLEYVNQWRKPVVEGQGTQDQGTPELEAGDNTTG